MTADYLTDESIVISKIENYIGRIYASEDIIALKESVIDFSSAIGFEHVSMSFNKKDTFELSGYPDIMTWDNTFQSDYRDGKWHDVDVNLKQALQTPEAFGWEVDCETSDKNAAPFMEFLASHNIKSGILIALSTTAGALSGMALSTTKSACVSAPILQMASIIAKTAMMKMQLFGHNTRLSTDHAANMRLLSARQLDILRWAAEGKSNRDIATIMGVAKRAVDYHLSQAFKKLNVASKAQAVSILANSNGFFGTKL